MWLQVEVFYVFYIFYVFYVFYVTLLHSHPDLPLPALTANIIYYHYFIPPITRLLDYYFIQICHYHRGYWPLPNPSTDQYFILYRCVLSITPQIGLPAKFDTLAIQLFFARVHKDSGKKKLNGSSAFGREQENPFRDCIDSLLIDLDG